MQVNCIHYRRGYKYQLTRNAKQQLPIKLPAPIVTDWFTISEDGMAEAFRGYAWDGASGPTYDSKSSMRPSLWHDIFYQCMRLGLLDPEVWRPVADDIFHMMCKQDGMWKARAWLWFNAVRIGAADAAKPGSEDPEECAPEGCLCPEALEQMQGR